MLSKSRTSDAHLSAERPDWFPQWTRAVIVAGGPSAAHEQLAGVRNLAPVLAVNAAFKLCPWADVLYGCDAKFWRAHTEAQAFQGLRVGSGADDWDIGPHVRTVHLLRERGIYTRGLVFGKPLSIGCGHNSGFQALNLALNFGAREVALVGYDYNDTHGIHWHGPHVAPLTNPRPNQLRMWAKILDEQAPALEARGIRVWNCSRTSTLRAFPVRSLIEITESWQSARQLQPC